MNKFPWLLNFRIYNARKGSCTRRRSPEHIPIRQTAQQLSTSALNDKRE